MLRALAKRHVLGRARLQPWFSLLHRVALAGMNFGPALPERTGELRLLDGIAAEDHQPVVFDVGANVGDYSTAVIRRLGGRVRLFAFEPAASTCEQLERRVGAAASVHTIALGDENGSAVLYSDRAASPIASLYQRDLGRSRATLDQKENVVVRRLDDFCSQHDVAFIDLLKLDVEGHELKVLQGARRLLDDGAIRIIQFEFGGANVDSRTFLRDFFELLSPRYAISRIVQDGLVSVDPYSEEHEIFVTVNYAAILRSR